MWIKAVALVSSLGLAALGIFTSIDPAPGNRSSGQGKVLLFISTDCPVAMKYTPRINALHEKYGEKFAFEAYFPNDLETKQGITKYGQERSYTFPMDLDLGAKLAKSHGVDRVPSIVILDSNGKQIYTGAIDDNRDSTLVKEKYAETVLEDVLGGRKPKYSKQVPFGCLLMPGTEPPSVAAVNYAEHIAPILNKHCVQCHRPGEVAPFSLIGYENAKKWAPMIAEVTQSRKMPPWKAVHGYGEFVDENRLTETQVQTLQHWNEAKAPRGSAKEPETPTFRSGWSLGDPDLVLSPTKPFKLGAEGQDVYRNFVFKTDFKETKWVTAMDVKPGNRQVVHHVIAFLDSGSSAVNREKENKDGQEGYSTFGGPGFFPSGALGGWAPGMQTRNTPDGIAFELKPGTTIVMQVHYHLSGKDETDQTKLGLYFADKPAKQAMNLAWIANPLFRIPPGAKNHKVNITYPIPADVTAYAAMPHMHLLGKSMKAEVEYPDGSRRPLVYVEDWDFNWQMMYAFREPMKLPKGSKIHVEAIYDNSSDNARNPNRTSPKPVTWGEQTTDEMFLLVCAFTVDGLEAGKEAPRLYPRLGGG